MSVALLDDQQNRLVINLLWIKHRIRWCISHKTLNLGRIDVTKNLFVEIAGKGNCFHLRKQVSDGKIKPDLRDNRHISVDHGGIDWGDDVVCKRCDAWNECVFCVEFIPVSSSCYCKCLKTHASEAGKESHILERKIYQKQEFAFVFHHKSAITLYMTCVDPYGWYLMKHIVVTWNTQLCYEYYRINTAIPISHNVCASTPSKHIFVYSLNDWSSDNSWFWIQQLKHAWTNHNTHIEQRWNLKVNIFSKDAIFWIRLLHK